MTRTIWRRRIALVAVVAFVVGIPLTLVLRGDDDDDSGGASVPELERSGGHRGIKVDYRLANGWRERKQGDTIKLRSRDRTAVVAIAGFRGRDRLEVLEDVAAAIRSNYRKVKLEPSGGAVGGQAAIGAIGSATSKRGTRLDLALSVVEGRKRTYLVEVFTERKASAERRGEVRATLDSLRLRG